jgi:hypothetical protein
VSLLLPQLLALAEKARVDPDLIPNHRGTVDRKLREHLDDCNQVLAAMEGAGDFEFESSLREEREAISNALTAYTTGLKGSGNG